MGDYLDAGSIVAGGAALPLWTAYLHFGSTTVSLIAAFSSNGISTGIGAFFAGRLGDRFGRKFIYSWDLLLYAVGALVVALAANSVMVIGGYMLLGLAVGVDVPTSWSLIAEYAPRRQRGKLMGFTNIFWYVGPIVILLLALAFHPLGLLGARLLFVSLLVVSLVTYAMRRQLVESPRWLLNAGRDEEVATALRNVGEMVPAPKSSATNDDRRSGAGRPVVAGGWGALLKPKYLRRLAFIMPLYLLWGIPAGTYGFFLPTLFKTIGAHSLATAYGLDILWFGSAILTVVFVFMPLNDRIDRRILYAISAAMCSAAFFILVFLPATNIYVAMGNILLFGLGQGVGLWPLQRVWSVELFPTEIRNTAQGFLWSMMRVVLGVWSFFLAGVTGALGFPVVALILALMFVYNMVVGGLLGPRTGGVALEEI
ncbi:MAG: MFS transporter [Acidimicrobiales bacterium]